MTRWLLQRPRDARGLLAAAAPQKSSQTPTPEQQADILHKYKGLLLVLALGYGIIFLLSGALVHYMRRNRTVALRGDSSAARKVILPAYVPLLLVLTVVSLVYSVYFWVTRFGINVSRITDDVEAEVYYSGRLFFILLLIVYLYQKSVTTPALFRATVVAVAASTYNIPVVWLTKKYGSDDLAYWVPTFFRLPLVMFYLWVFVNPPARASKRTLREYCLFVFVYYILYFAYNGLFRQGKLDEGFLFAYANIFWGALCPLVMWRVLKADTEHWRGLGRRAVSLQSLFRQKHNINERISSRGLHLLIEMHRKFIIDFAYLELKHKIGTGSSAVVFNGLLHSKTPVAVKVYTPNELTDDLVAEFSHEAALCGALHHPNIVKFYGMCVCPPTICLVSELCQGSLDVVTESLALRPHAITRQQLMINLNYMIDATRAVAYLHSFSPAFLHRDIKPSNFLLDRNCVVKLTDFGESRSLPKELGGSTVVGASSVNASIIRLSLDSMIPATTTAGQSDHKAMTVRGTADYMAPEIIQGKAGTAMYAEAADVFSLAMTFWDIMHPLDEKYPSANGNHLKVFEAVLAGQRPEMSEGFHPGLRQLLTQAWDERPEHRPTAMSILHSLEKIQQEVCSDVAMILLNSMEKSVVISKKGCTTENTISGQALVQKMLEFDFVGSIDEATRTGNGFMSAGLLHHARHVVKFSNSADMYVFDEAFLDAMQDTDERLYLPPIVERRDQTSVTGLQHEDPEDAEEMSVVDLDGSFLNSHNNRPVVDEPFKTPAAALVHVTPRRKTSRAGRRDDRRLSATAASQWTNTATMDASTCPCRRLGSGMLFISGQRRFRRGRKNRSGASVPGQTPHSSSATGVGLSLSRGVGKSALDENNGLTQKLLTSEFNTGDSAYDLFDSSTSEHAVELIIDHAHSSTDDDESDRHRDGSSSLNSSGVRSVDM